MPCGHNVQYAPADDEVNHDGSVESFYAAQLQGFDTTAAFEYAKVATINQRRRYQSIISLACSKVSTRRLLSSRQRMVFRLRVGFLRGLE